MIWPGWAWACVACRRWYIRTESAVLSSAAASVCRGFQAEQLGNRPERFPAGGARTVEQPAFRPAIDQLRGERGEVVVQVSQLPIVPTVTRCRTGGLTS